MYVHLTKYFENLANYFRNDTLEVCIKIENTPESTLDKETHILVGVCTLTLFLAIATLIITYILKF